MLAPGIEIESFTDTMGHKVRFDSLWVYAFVSPPMGERVLRGGLTGAQRTTSSFATMYLFREGSRAWGISSKNNVFAVQSNCL